MYQALGQWAPWVLASPVYRVLMHLRVLMDRVLVRWGPWVPSPASRAPVRWVQWVLVRWVQWARVFLVVQDFQAARWDSADFQEEVQLLPNR